MSRDELPSRHVSADRAPVSGSKAGLRPGLELDDLREQLTHAQRVFDDYRAARVGRQREADLAWAKLVQEAALALPRPLPIAIEQLGRPAPLDQAPGAAAVLLPPPIEPKPLPAWRPIAVAPVEESAAPALRGGKTRRAAVLSAPVPSRVPRPFLAVVLVAGMASLSAVGLAHLKMRGPGNSEQTALLPGTAFEGTITPANQFTIAAPATTVVERVLVSVGERVAAGQPLLVANDRDARAAVYAAEIELRAADARIADVRQRLAILRQAPAADFARATGRVSTAQRESEEVPTRQWRDSPERAAAAHELAGLRFDRVKKLADQGLVARQELEDAEISLRVAVNDLENARRAAQAVATLTNAQTEQSDLQWKLARAEHAQQREARRAELALAELRRDDASMKLEAAADRLAAATIKASSTGVVTELLVQPGDQVYGGAPLVKLAVLDPLLAEVQVAPALINALRPGAGATVTLPGIPPQQVSGTIVAVNPIPNRNGNHRVQVRFENPAGHLLAGQPAEVRFVLP
jgi:multidrug efflux pump subunit AcrA (membrane-fusion protein)